MLVLRSTRSMATGGVCWRSSLCRQLRLWQFCKPSILEFPLREHSKLNMIKDKVSTELWEREIVLSNRGVSYALWSPIPTPKQNPIQKRLAMPVQGAQAQKNFEPYRPL